MKPEHHPHPPVSNAEARRRERLAAWLLEPERDLAVHVAGELLADLLIESTPEQIEAVVQEENPS